MIKIIGVTGMMGSGKSTLINNLKKLDKDNNYLYLNVDDFRRNISVLEELKPYIYSDLSKMISYKKKLYESLTQYLSNIKKSIIVEWALIVEDDIVNLFDFLIIVTCDKKTILKRLEHGNLTLKEIKDRLNRQMTTQEKLKHLIDKKYIVINDKYDERKLIELIGDDNYGM